MKRQRLYITILVLCAVVFVLAEIFAPRALDWSRSYDGRSDEPFGTLATARFLPEVFPGNRTIEVNESVMESLTILRPGGRDAGVNYVFINNGFDYRGQGVDMRLDQFETEALLDFVAEGNQVFIATQDISGLLADTLRVEFRVPRGILATEPAESLVQTYITSPGLPDSASFEVSSSLANGYFSRYDTLRTTELGFVEETDERHVNFIRIDWGMGRIFLHANPGLFSNYALAEAGAANYTFAALSHLPNTTTLRDEYYKTSRGRGARTPLRYILADPDLRTAYAVGMTGIFLFLVFGARRRQRVIPIVEPPVNATLTYVTTIGRLHLAERNHLATAKRKVDHWIEFIRDELSLDARSIEDVDVARVVARAGVDVEAVENIVVNANRILRQSTVSSADLIALASGIDDFYVQCQRYNV